MKVLVTGSTGFIGRALCPLLEARGHVVRRMQRQPGALGTMVLDLETALADPLRLDDALDGVDAVVHLAWGFASNLFRDDPVHTTVNLAFTRLLVDRVAERPGVRWVGAGSQAEYGRQEVVLRPDTPTTPSNAYGAAKCAAGDYALARLPERAAWARVLTAYGPGDDPNKFIPYLLSQYGSGQEAVMSPGAQRWDFLFVTDAAAAFADLLEAPRAVGRFVIAAEETATFEEIATGLFQRARAAGWPALPPRLGGRPYLPNDRMLLVGDASRLRAATGWRPTVSLAAGMDRLIAAWSTSQVFVGG
jgi:nucleoside-diphosphate-sugar epimerase